MKVMGAVVTGPGQCGAPPSWPIPGHRSDRNPLILDIFGSARVNDDYRTSTFKVCPEPVPQKWSTRGVVHPHRSLYEPPSSNDSFPAVIWMTRKEAAAFLRLPPSTLANWHWARSNPR
jgi:hypothetical protein